MTKKKHSTRPRTAAPLAAVPDGVRQPADHKPAAERQPVTVEVDGLALTIDGTALDDVELFDLLDRFGTDDADALRLIPKIIRGLFGDAQFAQVMEHLRDADTRRVSFERASLFLGEALGALNPNS